MKKYFILAYICLSSMYLNAQKGDSKVYLKVFGSYGFPTSASYRSTSYTSSEL
jgi:hypothetical protein